MHFAIIARILGWLLIATGASMALPLAMSVWLGLTGQTLAFGLTSLAIIFVGGATVLTIPRRNPPDVVHDAIPILAVFWLFMPACAALPFYWSSSLPNAADAYFEAVSGLTTTGATVYVELAPVPIPLIFWRSFLQWVGGLATIISVAMLLAPTRRREHPGYGALKLGHMAHEGGWLPRGLRSVILPMYTGITFGTWALLTIVGLPGFDALCLAMSAVSTGGFMPRDGTLELYGTPLAAPILGLAMLSGAVSLIWLSALLQLRWRETLKFREPYWVIATLLFATIWLASTVLANVPDTGVTDALADLAIVFATTASLVTTTGLQISHRTQELVPVLLLLGLAFLGAGRFSTAGGLKFFRLGTMLRQCDVELRKLIYPNSIQSGDERRGGIGADLISAVWANFAVAALAVIVVAVVCASDGQSLTGALMAATAVISNAGPLFQMATIDGVYAAGHYAQFSDPTKVLLGLAMVLGRFEILALLSLLNTLEWRRT